MIKANFMAAGMAGVVGAVDGTHMQIIAPSKDEDVFVNRKKWARFHRDRSEQPITVLTASKLVHENQLVVVVFRGDEDFENGDTQIAEGEEDAD
ncbi:hypothetical protein N1851_022708 [Merluccius polli]|uniref:DDE Tnp4 domain-containing protein n=1 Tax=Merluccius polli TaxID=89951 RepID=A0AA47MHQ5_MERPO|nr:hypothetical protein N1851_022708 [Merluccius polli]